MFKFEQIQQLDDFIVDLNQEKKPRAYSQGDKVTDPETEKNFETVRAVRRLRKGNPGRIFFHGRLFKGIVTAAVALLLAVGLLHFPGNKEVNIVHAVVNAYEELQSYSGLAEIRSEKNGEVEFQETIEIQYKKPFQYAACHRYNSSEVRYISDGEKLAVIQSNRATIDHVFPEKELWRYHVGTAVWELQEAEEVNTLGTEKLFGRTATMLEYRFIGDNVFHQIWIDKATKLPLRKILNLPEGSALIVEFKDLQINPVLDDALFSWTLPPGIKVRELNRTGTLQEIKKAWPKAARFPEILPAEMELKKVGILENDPYEYVLRFQGAGETDFIDVFFTINPEKHTFTPGAEYGTLAGGYVFFDPKTRKVFDYYIGEYATAQWTTDEAAVFIVSSRDIPTLQHILEKLAGEKIVRRAAPQKGKAELYFMEVTETDFKLGREMRATAGAIGPRELLEELLKGPQKEGLTRVIPEGTRLFDLWTEDQTVYVDFSSEITAGNFGSGTEGVLISSIVWTLTQLEEIESVQILVEGKVVETIAGHVSTGKPLRR